MIERLNETEGLRDAFLEHIADWVDQYDIVCEGDDCRAEAEGMKANTDYPHYGEGFYERWYD